jgi:DNA-binding GntR family transcriptional regulator
LADEELRVTPILSPSLVDVLVQQLLALIVSGAVKPGDRLREERLTAQFRVSRPPLREALRILERDGVIKRLPRRGVIVAPLGADDIREIYSLRWALEKLALELAMPVKDPSGLDPLRAALEQIRRAADTADLQALVDANLAFHLAVCSLPGHSRLLSTYRTLTHQLRVYMAANLRFRQSAVADPQDSVRRHERLLAVISSGDLDAVMREIGEHGDRAFLNELPAPPAEPEAQPGSATAARKP